MLFVIPVFISSIAFSWFVRYHVILSLSNFWPEVCWNFSLTHWSWWSTHELSHRASSCHLNTSCDVMHLSASDISAMPPLCVCACTHWTAVSNRQAENVFVNIIVTDGTLHTLASDWLQACISCGINVQWHCMCCQKYLVVSLTCYDDCKVSISFS